MNKVSALNLVQSTKFAVTAASALSAVGGAAIGYVVANKRLEKKYLALLDEEIAEAKAFYKTLNKDEYDGPGDLVDELGLDEEPDIRPEVAMVKEAVEILKEQKYVSYDKPETLVSEKQLLEVKESIQKNIFEEHGSVKEETVVEAVIYTPEQNGGFSEDEELDKKAKGEPYILAKDDFFENEMDYSQSTFTWFEGDSVMADDQTDEEIRDWDRVLGIANLQFGRGSHEEHIVYICNEKLEATYEVKRSEGKYSVEVAGLEDELYHDAGPRVRKFRKSWD